MDKRIRYFIAGVVAVAAGSLIFYFVTDVQNQAPNIVTDPRVTQTQAIDIVSNDLDKRYPGFDSNDLSLFASGRGQVLVEEFLRSGSQLPLIFFHENGTQFMIDSNTQSVKTSCPPNQCSDFGGAARNKLTYVLEIDCQECGFQHYLVDATTGSVIYHSPDPLPRNQTNQTSIPHA